MPPDQKPLLTLFTAPKSFTDRHIQMIQRNALRNWLTFGDDVEVVVIGDEPGISETCEELGLRHLPDVRCNGMGTPLISSIFELARGVNNSPFLAYSNADILFLPEFIQSVRILAGAKEKFLAVGQRWDLDVEESLTFSSGWNERLRKRVKEMGRLHGQTGSDYFIYPRSCFNELPDFAVGRAGWDNWMIFKARRESWPVVDLTKAVMVVHQGHDYAHLPGGIIHFYQPETEANVRIAGGRRTIFKLTDATHELVKDDLQRKSLDWSSFWREVEIFPLIKLHSRFFGWLSFALFHPVKAFNEIKGWMAYKFQRS